MMGTQIQEARVDPSTRAFVGDDLLCDIAGARRVGMRTIRVRRPGRDAATTCLADAVVDGIGEVPDVPASTFAQIAGWAA